MEEEGSEATHFGLPIYREQMRMLYHLEVYIGRGKSKVSAPVLEKPMLDKRHSGNKLFIYLGEVKRTERDRVEFWAADA